MTLLLLFGAAASVPVSTEPGGGGYGAQMSDAFLQRYTPTRQGDAYTSRYKPTIRKQKG